MKGTVTQVFWFSVATNKSPPKLRIQDISHFIRADAEDWLASAGWFFCSRNVFIWGPGWARTCELSYSRFLCSNWKSGVLVPFCEVSSVLFHVAFSHGLSSMVLSSGLQKAEKEKLQDFLRLGSRWGTASFSESFLLVEPQASPDCMRDGTCKGTSTKYKY